MNYVYPEKKKVMMRNIIGTALEDKAFKERLIKNPDSAIRELYPDFVSIPENPTRVVDQSDEIMTQYVNISRMSYHLLGGNVADLEIELADEELEMVAGGWSCWGDSCPGSGDGLSIS